MIEIGGRPILWHIMKIYAHHGVTDFVICLGYKGYMIKEYFMNFVLHHSDVTIDAGRTASPTIRAMPSRGDHAGGHRGGDPHRRPLKRVRNYLDPDEPFCFTYGDGLSDIDIAASIAFHRSHGKLATVSAVRPPGRYGALELDGRW